MLVSSVLVAAATTSLVVGAGYDAAMSRIPNWVTLLGLTLSAAAAGAGLGMAGLWTSMAAAGIALAIGIAAFAVGAFGGGDGKFLTVGAAFVGLDLFGPYLLATALAGGALAVGAVLWRRQSVEAAVMTGGLLKHVFTLGKKGYRATIASEGRLTVPYGVAIAAAALVTRFTPWAEWALR